MSSFGFVHQGQQPRERISGPCITCRVKYIFVFLFAILIRVCAECCLSFIADGENLFGKRNRNNLRCNEICVLCISRSNSAEGGLWILNFIKEKSIIITCACVRAYGAKHRQQLEREGTRGPCASIVSCKILPCYRTVPLLLDVLYIYCLRSSDCKPSTLRVAGRWRVSLNAYECTAKRICYVWYMMCVLYSTCTFGSNNIETAIFRSSITHRCYTLLCGGVVLNQKPMVWKLGQWITHRQQQCVNVDKNNATATIRRDTLSACPLYSTSPVYCLGTKNASSVSASRCLLRAAHPYRITGY